ncbi:MAG: hypothetical protein ABIO55_16430, partial [Ginsengibacter sp.]
MKNIFTCFVISLILSSCGNDNNPDVSGIKINIKVQRFEKDFFALDTNHLAEGLQQLRQTYPAF